MGKKSCSMVPQVTVDGHDEDSNTYNDLLKKFGNKPFVNYLYASYLNPGVASAMDSMHMERNKQGEHSASDICKFLGIDKTLSLDNISLSRIAKNEGVYDANFIAKNFTSEEALNKAFDINNSRKDVVAIPIKNGDTYNVKLFWRDSKIIDRVYDIETQHKMWEIVNNYITALNNSTFTIDQLDFASDIVNPLQVKGFIQWMNNIKLTRNSIMSVKDIKMLLVMNQNDVGVQRLIQKYGDVDSAAQNAYDSSKQATRGNYTAQEATLIDSTLSRCSKLQGLDLRALNADIQNNINIVTSNSEAYATSKTLKDLDQKYKLEENDIKVIGDNIKSFTDAAALAALQLKRRIAEIKRTTGISTESERLDNLLNSILHELDNNRYYSGVLNYLQEAVNQLPNIQSILTGAFNSQGTIMEQCMSIADAITEVDKLRDQYYPIVEALSNMDKLIMRESISQANKDVIENMAKQVREVFDNMELKIKDLKEHAMADTIREFLGPDADNISVHDTILMLARDISATNYLYSMGRTSSPIINAMGKVIKDAQLERNKKMQEYSLRVRRITNKLYSAGYDTSFMYDGEYIVSQYDWELYNNTRNSYYKILIANDIKGRDLELEMQHWEDTHTKDIVVDNTNGRTEKVPIYENNPDFMNGWSDEQKDYYMEMMQIKGEIGSMLPKYAQNQFRPPQVRKTYTDMLIDSKGNPIKVGKLEWEKIKDFWTIREDDTNYVGNTISLNSSDYAPGLGNYKGEALRDVPLFFMNKLKDQSQLSRNFSGSMQHLLGTAINYQCMSKIKNLVELMKNYTEDLSKQALRGNKGVREVMHKADTKISGYLYDHAKATNTIGIMEGFIEKYIYGVRRQGNGSWDKIINNLINYTSVKSLAVNLKGAVSNWLVGELQLFIESGAGEFFNMQDYLYAQGREFGKNTIEAPERFFDYICNNRNTMSQLLAQRFDPLNENFSEESNRLYYKSKFRNFMNKGNKFIGYSIGENTIHFVTMYAILHNQKIKINGKEGHLAEAFKLTDKIDGNKELELKPNVTRINEEGQEVPVDEQYLDWVKARIKFANQQMHGSMNDEDKGLIHQRTWGRAVMNLRQWMVEHYSKRFRQTYRDAETQKEREGYYTTLGRMLQGLSNHIFKTSFEGAIEWKNMNSMQKANFRRCMMEFLTLALLLSGDAIAGDPKDYKDKYWRRFWLYQLKRALVDVRGSTPIGIPYEAQTILQSPASIVNTVQGLLYPVYGIGDIGEEVKRGPYKGWNKYTRNVYKYSIPYLYQIDRTIDMANDDDQFTVFNKGL